MTGCIEALCCWRRKRPANDAANEPEKPHAIRVDSVDTVDTVIPDPEKPPLEVRPGHVGHASTGAPVRAGVKPASSTLADTKWADSGSTKTPHSFRDDATLKDEELDETEERERRRKAEEEEQERLDFFQMM